VNESSHSDEQSQREENSMEETLEEVSNNLEQEIPENNSGQDQQPIISDQDPQSIINDNNSEESQQSLDYQRRVVKNRLMNSLKTS